jgi:hypothetical protein
MLSTMLRPILSSPALRSDKLKESFGELAFFVELLGVGELFFSDFIVTATICQIPNGVHSLGKGRGGSGVIHPHESNLVAKQLMQLIEGRPGVCNGVGTVVDIGSVHASDLTFHAAPSF